MSHYEIKTTFCGRDFTGSCKDDGKILTVTCAFGSKSTHSFPTPTQLGHGGPPPMAYTLIREILQDALDAGKLDALRHKGER